MVTNNFFSNLSESYWQIIRKESLISRLASLSLFVLFGLCWAFHLRSYQFNFPSTVYFHGIEKQINYFWWENTTFFLIALFFGLRWFFLQFQTKWFLRLAQISLLLAVTVIFSRIMAEVQEVIALNNLLAKGQIDCVFRSPPPIIYLYLALPMIILVHEIAIILIIAYKNIWKNN